MKLLLLRSLCFFNDTNIVSLAGNHININECIFNGITNQISYGGAIYCDKDVNFTVAQSVFYNCRAYSQGGAIYLSSTNSNTWIYSICGSMCNSPYFPFCVIAQGTNNIASIKMASVSKCSNVVDNNRLSFFIVKAHVEVDSSNSSYNYVLEYSGIQIQETSSMFMQFCTYVGNYAGMYITDYFYSIPAPFTIRFLNFISNAITKDNLGQIYIKSCSNIVFDFCHFSNNNKVLFAVESSSASATNSFISHSSIYYGSFSYLNLNNTINGPYLSPQFISHFYTGNCEAFFIPVIMESKPLLYLSKISTIFIYLTII